MIFENNHTWTQLQAEMHQNPLDLISNTFLGPQGSSHFVLLYYSGNDDPLWALVVEMVQMDKEAALIYL